MHLPKFQVFEYIRSFYHINNLNNYTKKIFILSNSTKNWSTDDNRLIHNNLYKIKPFKNSYSTFIDKITTNYYIVDSFCQQTVSYVDVCEKPLQLKFYFVIITMF